MLQRLFSDVKQSAVKTYPKLVTLFIFVGSLLFALFIFTPQDKLIEALIFGTVFIIGFVVAFWMAQKR